MKVNGDINKFYHYAFPMQAVLVTCNDQNDKTNIITVAWHTTISRKPPLYGISLAPKRYSYGLIQKTKEFVINFVPFSLVEKVHFCGTHSGRTVDKIKETKLTLMPSQKIKTPCIQECFAHFECKLNKTMTLGDHILVISEIVNVIIDEDAFKKDLLDVSKIQPTYYIGDNIYTTINTNEKEL
jgi:flavin reductase (DIM6/NTAB) family NADH-FMN oxidoreductase RutF